MDTPVISALIAAAVSLAGVAVALYSSNHQLRTKVAELDLKRQELDAIGMKLQAEADALRQNLMRDILAKRMLAYAALWKVFISYERNWLLEQRPFDLSWAETFLRELNACNAEHGVFFSQQVYEPFFEYRSRLLLVLAHLRSGNEVGEDKISSLIEVSSTGIQGKLLALGTAMKDDLGSYMKVAVQAS
jgi:hypothetical protein